MLKEQVQKGILFFMVIVNIIMIMFVGTLANSVALNAYPIALYLLVLVLWWRGNKVAKFGIRISFAVLSLILLILCFSPDLHNLGRLDTLRNRIFDMFGSGVFIGAVVLVVLATIGLFFVNPNYKTMPSETLVDKTGKWTIIFIWMYIFFVLIEQSYFIARHNVAPANFYACIKKNNLFWLRDFIYGRIPYLLALTDVLFEVSLFSFITLNIISTEFYKAFVFKPIVLKIILVACFLLLFISIVNNRIVEFIIEISIAFAYFWLLNSMFLYTDNVLINTEKFYSQYSSRGAIKFWIITVVLLNLLGLIYFIVPLSYNNFYISVKILLQLLLALFTTVFIIQLSKKNSLFFKSSNYNSNGNNHIIFANQGYERDES